MSKFEHRSFPIGELGFLLLGIMALASSFLECIWSLMRTMLLICLPVSNLSILLFRTLSSIPFALRVVLDDDLIYYIVLFDAKKKE